MDENTIVVGVDGSAASAAALRWAAAQAPALDARIVAVHAWERSLHHRAPYAPATGESAEQERGNASLVLERAVTAALGAHPAMPVSTVVVQGPAVPALLHYADHALLLALGHHHHPDPAMPPIGPTVRGCMRNATVPVVAVPAELPSRSPTVRPANQAASV
ncbi:universal stress protein [Streptomyces sp. AM8-1-1]|uniref:universal stress protein n=1 Tax=Streptomyces sp. AM8-1-1 TaxID=3075825 RepID=UPI0028C3DCA8|nr:universal stress protein [Streptomyces sp. AM8-1-1]WNO70277.1 universal stress protein [Streptomyces sp. AM8-1-1]